MSTDLRPRKDAVRLRTAALGALGLLAVATASAGALVVVRAGEALPGTTVAGVDVGGLGRADLRSALQSAVDARSTGTLELVHEERRFSVDRGLLDVDVDVERTVEAALEAGRDDGLERVVGPLLGRGEPVELSSTVDLTPVRQEVDRIGDELDAEPFPGGIRVEPGTTTVTVEPPRAGLELDREEAVTALADAVVSGREQPLELPVAVEEPPTTADDVEQVAERARQVLDAPLRLTRDTAVLEISLGELGPLLRAEPADGGLRLGVDTAAFEPLVLKKADRLDVPPVKARFAVPPPPTVDAKGDLSWTPQPAPVSVTPGRPGLDVDAAETVRRALALVAEGRNDGELPAKVVPPDVGPEQVQSTGITSLLGTFTTYFAAGQPRVTNIRKIASVVDDTYLSPGEVMSLNEVAGPRTRGKGYVEDSAIIDGELVPQVGGGVSQFATTLFNAAFFAGLPIEEHKPHSFYISRYPAGRESTVSYGSIDVKIRNDTARGLVVKTWSTPSSVTVGLYGDNGGRVVTSRSGPREPREGGGFRISVTRTVTGGDGKGGTRTFRTAYNPPPD